jgi:nucleoside-diphosphate-sugar epimerase
MSMRILISGAQGFLGSACVLILRAAGHEVITTDRRGAVDHAGDLADEGFCSTLPAVDVVVHSAAVQYVSTDLPLLRRERYFERNNVLATRQLIGRYASTGVHFVNIGTSMMYQQLDSGVYRPSSSLAAQGVYSRSKLDAQLLLQAVPGLRWATVVPCIIGGAGRGGLFNGFVRSIQRLGVAVCPGSGRFPIAMVHVNDVATLVETLVRVRATGIYNAAARDPLTLLEWIGHTAMELGRPAVRIVRIPIQLVSALARASRYRLLAAEQLQMLLRPHILDISASEALGWSPKLSNLQTLQEIVRYTGRQR